MEFKMNDMELAMFKEWKIKHDKKCKLKKKGKPRNFTFCFTPTGIGSIVEVECSCGKSVNVTDFNSW